MQWSKTRWRSISTPVENIFRRFLLTLEAQGLECHRNGMFVGAFIYADDITILAPTSTSLNKTLDTCKLYADE